MQQKVERLIKIWDERRVFGTSSTQSFKKLATGAGAAETPKKAAGMDFCPVHNYCAHAAAKHAAPQNEKQRAMKMS